MTTDTKITHLLSEAFAEAPTVESITKLHGDASYRTYYRLFLKDGRSYIVMQLPEGKASASEEITNFSGTIEETPFQNVQRFLKSNAIPVPDIIFFSPDLRMMLLEDCGDTLLYTKVAQTSDTDKLFWYGKAVDLLSTIQAQCGTARPHECIALQRSFDATLLNWEFAHFIEWAIDARRNEALPEKVQKECRAITNRITKAITELPYGFTHRDYQSRNILIQNDSLVVIDFQDALRGPYIYDLVALLRDSYVTLSADVLQKLIGQYAALRDMPLLEVQSAFDLVTVQRKLKDAGRFVYIDRVKGNPNYLEFIPTSLGYARDALNRINDGPELLALLTPYVPEWQS
ncbi:MAG: aminoglycoside phosphotransferase [Deltaproteobacteria bacterium CG11_big_fil_rev_8_21_14_0_20_47_16]|nr:MAG: aminoglycoside phosphotransferase [Deltaproteobacteria bacterium CG11_big_fil_rev_8_21_14_0_20_47_16]